MELIILDTHAREELVDITEQVNRAIARSGVENGICHLWCHHTTAGLTVNENADHDVKIDLLMALSRIVHDDWNYQHAEGNSPAHVKSSLIGCQLALPVQGGRLELGAWQGVLFAEFDGPRRGRKVTMIVIPYSYPH
jgi:secondary thiamine-phosphate synthase enzyme